MISRERQTAFIRKLQEKDTVDFPLVATECGLDFFTEVQPAINQSLEFYLRIKGVLTAYKYKLIASITSKDPPPLSNVKAMVEYIDSDVLLTQEKDKETDNKTKRAVSAAMRQGLGLEPNGKKTKLKTTKASKEQGSKETAPDDLLKDDKVEENENSDDTSF